MEFTDEEVEVIKKLLDDHGWYYGLKTTTEEANSLRRKLGMKEE